LKLFVGISAAAAALFGTTVRQVYAAADSNIMNKVLNKAGILMNL